MNKADTNFAYNTKIIETPTTKEIYLYEKPIYIKADSDNKTNSNEQTSQTEKSERKTFDEMSASNQYDSLKRKQKHYEQMRWEIARIVDCNFDNQTKFITLTFKENVQEINQTNRAFK